VDSKKKYHALYAGVDDNKDQTYFLWTLSQERLHHVLFPIGEYKKPEIRKIAEKAGLYTAKKKDSQGICFIGKVPLQFFLSTYLPEKKGETVTVSGEVVGTHKGAMFYTIGQRHGFTISIKKKPGEHQDRGPFYVVKKDISKNLLIVAEGAENPALFVKSMDVIQINWINPDAEFRFVSGKTATVSARVRYRQQLHSAKVIPAKNGKPNQVIFSKPQQYVAEGQSLVFYDKNGECLGGGVIANPEYIL
jgi:tRNA-specific 2-thiouridylase